MQNSRLEDLDNLPMLMRKLNYEQSNKENTGRLSEDFRQIGSTQREMMQQSTTNHKHAGMSNNSENRNIKEIASLARNKLESFSKSHDLSKVCHQYDVDKRGGINYKDFQDLLTASTSGLSANEAHNLAYAMDKGKLGSVDYKKNIIEQLKEIEKRSIASSTLEANNHQQRQQLHDQKSHVSNLIFDRSHDKDNLSNKHKSIYHILESTEFEPVYIHRSQAESQQNNEKYNTWVVQAAGGVSNLSTKEYAKKVWNKESIGPTVLVGTSEYSTMSSQGKRRASSAPRSVRGSCKDQLQGSGAGRRGGPDNVSVVSSMPPSVSSLAASSRLSHGTSGAGRGGGSVVNNASSQNSSSAYLSKAEITSRILENNVVSQIGGDVGKLRFALKHFDSSRSGLVNFEEFRCAAVQAGIHLPTQALQSHFQRHVQNPNKQESSGIPTGAKLLDVNAYLQRLSLRANTPSMSNHLQKSNSSKVSPKDLEVRRVAKKVLGATCCDTTKHPIAVFEAFGGARDGWVHPTTLRKGLSCLGATLCDSEFGVLLDQIDPRRDGRIDLRAMDQLLHRAVADADRQDLDLHKARSANTSLTIKSNDVLHDHQQHAYEPLYLSKDGKKDALKWGKLKSLVQDRKHLLKFAFDANEQVNVSELRQRLADAGIPLGVEDAKILETYVLREQPVGGRKNGSVSLGSMCSAVGVRVSEDHSGGSVLSHPADIARDGGILSSVQPTSIRHGHSSVFDVQRGDDFGPYFRKRRTEVTPNSNQMGASLVWGGNSERGDFPSQGLGSCHDRPARPRPSSAPPRSNSSTMGSLLGGNAPPPEPRSAPPLNLPSLRRLSDFVETRLPVSKTVSESSLKPSGGSGGYLQNYSLLRRSATARGPAGIGTPKSAPFALDFQ